MDVKEDAGTHSPMMEYPVTADTMVWLQFPMVAQPYQVAIPPTT